MRPCPYAGGTMAAHTIGPDRSGSPVLGTTNAARQRECIATGRCVVCHKELPRGERWIATHEQPATFNALGRSIVGPFDANGMTCRACMRFSIGACPGLRRVMFGEGTLYVVRLVAYDVVRLTFTPGIVGLLGVIGVEWESFTAERFLGGGHAAREAARAIVHRGAPRSRHP